jgi:drug/metabolite transporter (DMT)-like permease
MWIIGGSIIAAGLVVLWLAFNYENDPNHVQATPMFFLLLVLAIFICACGAAWTPRRRGTYKDDLEKYQF